MSYFTARERRLQALDDADDWAGIVRLSISLGIETTDIARALEVAKRIIYFDPQQSDWLEDLLKTLRADYFNCQISEGTLEGEWSEEEIATIAIIQLYSFLGDGHAIDMAKVDSQEEKYNRARAAAEHVVKIAMSINDVGMMAFGQSIIANCCCVSGDGNSAVAQYSQIIRLYMELTATFGSLYSRVLACTFGNLGRAQQMIQLDRQAAESFEQAVRAFETAFEDDIARGWHDIAVAKMSLAHMQTRLLEYEEALANYDSALNTLDQAPCQNEESWFHRRADILSHKAILLKKTHAYEEADWWFGEAAAVYEELSELNKDYLMPDHARVHRERSESKWRLGKPREGLNEIQKSIDLYESLVTYRFNVHAFGLVVALRKLGAINFGSRDLKEAMAAHRRALELMVELIQKAPQTYAGLEGIDFLNLGEDLYLEGNNEAANSFLMSSLRSFGWKESVDALHCNPKCIDALNCISRTLSAVGKTEAAKEPLLEALRIANAYCDKNATAWLPVKSKTLCLLGEVLIRSGLQELGLEKIGEGIKCLTSLVERHPTAFVYEQLSAYRNMARGILDEWKINSIKGKSREWWQPEIKASLVAHFFDGDENKDKVERLHEAAHWLQRARRVGEQAKTFFDDHSKRKKIHGQMLDIYELSMAVSLCQWKYDPENTGCLEECFAVGEGSRARTINELLAHQSLPARHCDQDLTKRFTAIRRILYSRRSELQDLDLISERAQVAEEIFETADLRDKGTLQRPNNGEEKAKLELQKQLLEARIRKLREWIEADEAKYDDLLSDIRRADPNYDPEVPIKPVSLDVLRKHLPKKSLAVQFTVFEDYGFAILISDKAIDAVALPDCSRRALRPLTNEWIESINSNDPGNDGIDRIIARLSETVIKPLLEGIPNGTVSLVLAPNTDLHQFPLQACFVAESTRLIDVFEVTYCPSFSLFVQCAERECSESPSLLMVDIPSVRKKLRFHEVESGKIERCFKPEQVDKISSPAKARYEIFKKSGATTIWHFSGHAEFNFVQPLDSRLRLGDNAEDSLRLQDIYEKLDVNKTNLAILAGCQTGRVRPDVADEAMSFPTAFLYAGARKVIYSLWAVNDLTSMLMFVRFYKNLQNGGTVGLALRDAQLWLKGTPDSLGECLASGKDLIQFVAREHLLDQISNSTNRSICQKILSRYELENTAPFAAARYWAAFVVGGTLN